MRLIVRIWLSLVLALGVMIQSVQAVDPEEGAYNGEAAAAGSTARRPAAGDAKLEVLARPWMG